MNYTELKPHLPAGFKVTNLHYGHHIIETPFYYPNGDGIVLYLRQRDNATIVCDAGMTALMLSQSSGIELSLTTRELFRACAVSEMKVDGDCGLYRRINNDNPATDIYRLCEGILLLSGLMLTTIQYGGG